MRRPSNSARKTNTRKKSKVPEGKPSRRKPARRSRRFPWSSLVLIIACLTAGFLIGRSITPPLVEVPIVPLSQKIHLVDVALKSQFYMLGLSEQNVVSRKSVVRKKGEQKWTQTTTKIQLPKAIPSGRIVGRLNRELGALGKDFFLIKKRDEGGILELQVRILDVVAHNLVFYEPKVVKPKILFKGRVAIVIDDLGMDRKVAMNLLDLEMPLSFSVFPFAPYSQEFAKEATKRGRDVLLHLPMEPNGYPGQDPGEGRLLTTMRKEELLSQLEENLSAVPSVKGVNNHMGSKFTENPEMMRTVLEHIQKRGLFFLDSRTTPRTVGFEIAREIGVKTGQRNVFLDNERDISKIKAKISELRNLSLRNGEAIGIGHPYPETVQAIRETVPSFVENGVELVPVSSLLK